jgi:tRNA C32,U32 (ribose-2'-O)-methylase TrmJ
MSVLLICYEWFFNTTKIDKTTDIPIKNEKVMANKSELNYFIDRLVSILDSTNFFTPDEKRKVMINNIEAIFTRNNLTLQELNTLHGIISSIIRS